MPVVKRPRGGVLFLFLFFFTQCVLAQRALRGRVCQADMLAHCKVHLLGGKPWHLLPPPRCDGFVGHLLVAGLMRTLKVSRVTPACERDITSYHGHFKLRRRNDLS